MSLSIIYCRFNRFLCQARARAGLKSVAGGLSERMKQIRAECPSNFLRTTLFFVEKGEKEKHRRRIPLFSLALTLAARRAIENFGFISAQSFIAWIYVRGRSAEPSLLLLRSEQFRAVCGAGRARRNMAVELKEFSFMKWSLRPRLRPE